MMLTLVKLALALLLVAGSHATSPQRPGDVGLQPMTEPDLDTLSIYIKKTLENLREIMPKGIPELKIPPLEPFKIPVLNIPKIQQGAINVDLNLKDIIAAGLSSFVVREAKANPSTMSIELELFLPEVTIQAHYDLDGKVIIFPLYGKGPAGIQVNDLKIRLAASKTIENMKTIQLKDVRVDLSFSQVMIQLQGILGGGKIGDMVNMFLNVMGKLLYDKLKDRIVPEVTRIIVGVINGELRKVDLQQIIGGILPNAAFSAEQPFNNEANNYVDKVMENLRPHIRQNNLDPLALPEIRHELSHRLLLIQVRGSAHIYNGKVQGLSTLHRAGNCDIGHEGTTVIVGCIVGVNNLHGSFEGSLHYVITKRAQVTFNVDHARVSFRVKANIAQGAKPELDQFSIVEVSQIKVGIHHGLGLINWLINPLANLIVNKVKHRILEAVENQIRDRLRDIIGNIQLPILG